MSFLSPSVFITGVEGFVGAHLAVHLYERGYQIAGVYWLDPKADLSFARVARGDVRDAAEMQTRIAAANPRFVIHLAAISSVPAAEANPPEAFRTNVLGTINVLEAVRVLSARPKVLLASSSDVYDRAAAAIAPLSETSPLKPMNVYALTKLCAEQVGLYYAHRHGLDVVVLRPFSHTGPGQGADFVFASVAQQIAEAEAGKRRPEIEVGNVGVSRDYVDIRDICRAYELALSGTVSGEIYNVTSERPMRIGEGIDYLVSLARRPIAVKVAADRVRREESLLAGSSAKFRAATGWQAEIDIRQTLRDLLEYERGRLSSTG